MVLSDEIKKEIKKNTNIITKVNELLEDDSFLDTKQYEKFITSRTKKLPRERYLKIKRILQQYKIEYYHKGNINTTAFYKIIESFFLTS